MKLQDGTRVVTGNTYDKFRTRNPIARRMQENFLAAATQLMGSIEELGAPRSVLEVGCGPGDLAEVIVPSSWPYVGSDIGLTEVAGMRQQMPRAAGLLASAYELPFGDRAIDVVLACEVLEHLEEPERAIAELARVTSGFVLVSVPWEPPWRLLNLARGAYLTAGGNTPGHLQHFSRGAIRSLMRTHFDIVAERRPLPWTMLLVRARGS